MSHVRYLLPDMSVRTCALTAYRTAFRRPFGLAQRVRFFGRVPAGHGRYLLPDVAGGDR